MKKLGSKFNLKVFGLVKEGLSKLHFKIGKLKQELAAWLGLIKSEQAERGSYKGRTFVKVRQRSVLCNKPRFKVVTFRKNGWRPKLNKHKIYRISYAGVLCLYLLLFIFGSFNANKNVLLAANGSWTQTTFNGTNDGTYTNTVPADSNTNLALATIPTGLSNAGGGTWQYKSSVAVDNSAGGALSNYQVLLDSEKNVVGDWHFDEGSGTSVNDSSGNSITGTPNGATYWDASGKYGAAYKGAASGNYINFGTNSNLNMGTSDFTIGMWVKRAAINTDQRLFIKRQATSIWYDFYFGADNKIYASIAQNYPTIGYSTFNSTSTITDTTSWHYIAAAFDRDGNGQIYIDGSADGTPSSIATNSGSINNTGTAFLGGYGTDAGPPASQWFNGSIDEFKLYNKALSSTEVSSAYNDGGFFQRIKSDGSDIRFTDSDGTTELSYWIESLNNSTTAKNYKIWTKVPSIPASSTKTIYKYYGNASATSSSNGTNTFEFFDDFEAGNLSKWTVTGSPTTGASYAYSGNYGARVFGDYQTNYIRKTYSTSPAVIEWNEKYIGGYWYGGVSGTNPRLIGISDPLTTYNIYDGTYQTGGQITNGTSWHKYKTVIGPSSTTYHADNSAALYTTSASTNYSQVLFYTGNGATTGDAYVDNVFVRKYASSEPTVIPSQTSTDYVGSGNFVSSLVQPTGLYGNWGNLTFTRDVTGAGTALTIQVLKSDGSLVPDGDLAGNSAGFTASPVSLSTLSIASYPSLKLRANLSTSNQANTSKLNDWTVAYAYDATPPTTPILTIGTITSSLVALSWTASTDGESGLANPVYRVERAPDVSGAPGTWAQVGTTNSTVFTDNTVSQNTKYYFRVKAVDNLGNTSVSNSTTYDWFDANWQYRKQVTVSSGTALSDYQVLLDSEANVVGDWHFDEGAGATVNDSSGNGNNGTITIGVAGSQTTVAQAWNNGAPGKYGNALNFDGADDYVNGGTGPSLNITGPITISAWIYWKGSANAYSGIVSRDDSTNGYSLLIRSDNKLAFYLCDATTCNTTYNIDGLGGAVPLNVWTLVTATFDGSNITTYINNNLDFSKPRTNNYGTSTGTFYIGNDYFASRLFNGKIDEAKVYNRSFSAPDVQAASNDGGFWQKVKTDGGDIRITDSNGTTQIPYWIESINNSTTAKNYKIWAKVPSVTSPTKQIFMYYGNSAAATTSNGSNTFDFFDDFNRADNTTVGNGWTEDYDIGSINGNKLKITGINSTSTGWAIWKPYIPTQDMIYEVSMSNVQTPVGNQGAMFHVRGETDNRRMGFYYGAPNKMYLNNAGWASFGSFTGPYSADLRLDYLKSAGTVNYYENGSLVAANQTPFASSTMNRINFGDYNSNFIYYFDDLKIRKYAATEPTSSFGSEQAISFPSVTTLANTPTLNSFSSPTNDNTPQITGSVSGGAGLTVKLYDNGTEKASTTADGTGNFTFSNANYGANTFSDGNHTNITARSFNSNNDPSPDSNALTVFVDTQTATTNYSTAPVAPDGNGGWFKTDPIITLTPSDPSPSGGNGITYYKWNDPTFTSPSTYTAPLDMDLSIGQGTHTLYWRTIDSAGNLETIRNQQFKLDSANPNTLSISIAGGSQYTTLNPVNLTLSAADATSGMLEMQFSNDNILYGTWEPYSVSKPSWDLTTNYGGPSYSLDGLKPVYVKFKDNAGNITNQISAAITLDRAIPTNPTAAGQASPSDPAVITSGNWYNYTSPKFTLNGATDVTSGVDGYWVYWGGNNTLDPVVSGSYQVGNTYNPIVITADSGKTFYLRVRAKDRAGNLYSNADTSVYTLFTYKYDSTNPDAVSYITPDPAGWSVTNSFAFSWPAASDPLANGNASGLKGYEYKKQVDATWAFAGSTSISNITSYQNGVNILQIRTLDNAGNYSATIPVNYYYSGNIPAPQSLQADISQSQAQTINKFKFTWSAPTGVVPQGYYYSVNAIPDAQNATFTANAYTAYDAFATHAGLNTFYAVTKDENGNVGWTNYAQVSFTCNTFAPGIPQSIMITDSSNRESSRWQLTINWDQPTEITPDFNGYIVERSINNINWIQVATTAKETTGYLDTSLSNSTTYYYRIRAKDNIGNYSASSTVVSKQPTGRYTTPPNLIGLPTLTVQSTKAVMSWTTDREADSFVQLGPDTSYGMTQGQLDSTQTHTVNILGLTPGTTYHLRAMWRDIDSNVGYSNDLAIHTQEAPNISEVNITDIRLNSAIITWKTTSASTSKLYYGKTTSYGATIEDKSGSQVTTHTIKLENLEHTTTYHFKITGTDIDSNTMTSDDYAFDTLTFPRIFNLKIEQQKDTSTASIKATWESNVPTTSIIEYSEGGLSQSLEASSSKLELKHTIIIYNLKDNTQYRLIAKGRDAYGDEAVSDTLSLKTDFDTRPPEISNINVESSIVGFGADAKGQLVISWDTDEPATSQVVFGIGAAGTEYSYKTQEDSTYANSHLVIISDLKPSTSYHFSVISKDRSNNVSRSIDNAVLTEQTTESVVDMVIKSLQRSIGWLFGMVFGG
ncbi:MAG: DUF2341 domain-containing protein [Patescibacteria group bacterium]|nr:DUF2341 domain-containing protein [Patescibacteria group bacterium]